MTKWRISQRELNTIKKTEDKWKTKQPKIKETLTSKEKNAPQIAEHTSQIHTDLLYQS